MGEGGVATNITAIEYTVRSVISTTKSSEATPAAVLSKINEFKGSQGELCYVI